MLPAELWPIIGDFLFMIITPHEQTQSIKLNIKPSQGYAIIYPGDEPGEGFVIPCCIQ